MSAPILLFDELSLFWLALASLDLLLTVMVAVATAAAFTWPVVRGDRSTRKSGARR